jgi:hypothetical protein
MARCFWDTHFFSYLSNCQTKILTDDFTNFCNIIVSFRRWWPSRTRIIINRSSALFETFPLLVGLSPAHGFFPECYFQHFKYLSNRFSNFYTEFHTNSLLVKNTHFLVSREIIKQDRTMRFSRRSSSNSLLESITCHAPLGRGIGGLFWTFGNFPDSPCMFLWTPSITNFVRIGWKTWIKWVLVLRCFF